MRSCIHISRMLIFLLMLPLSVSAAAPDADDVEATVRQATTGKVFDGSSKADWRWLDGQGRVVQGAHGALLRFEGSQRGSGFSISFDAEPYRGTWFAVDVSVENDRGSGWVGPRFFISTANSKPFFDPALTRQTCTPSDDGWRTCRIYGYVPADATRISADVVGFHANYGVREFSVETVSADTDTDALAQKSADFDRAFALMRSRFFRSKEVDWDALAAQGRGWLKSPSRLAWISAVAWVSRELPSNGHTFVKAGPLSGPNKSVPEVSGNEVTQLDNRTGYVKLTASPESRDERLAYADPVRRQILALINKGTKVWIVDLRGNHGGSLYAMLNALSPLIGNRRLGYMAFDGGRRQAFGVSSSGSYLTDTDQFDVIHVAQPMDDLTGKDSVAVKRYVLIDHGCASACEAVAVALGGMPDTQTFGEASAGLTTANTTYPLGTQFELVLTEAYIQDIHGNRVYPRVEPATVLVGPEQGWLDDVRKLAHRRNR